MCRPSLYASTLAMPLLASALALGCSAASADGAAKVGSGGSSAQSSAGSGNGLPPLGSGASVPDLLPIPPTQTKECEAVLELTVRDFTPSHPDFESFNGLNDIGCGMVASSLGPDTKPVFSSGIGSMKRVTTGTFESLVFASCAPWNGWNPNVVITGQASFDQWYRDVEGVNQSFIVPVTLADANDGSGNLSYDSSAFFPIDGMGFGNTPNKQHNFHFTTEGHVRFGYVKGQKFTFRGDDDLWIFVNNKLALDLGGMHVPIAATIDFDVQAAELGIVPGGTYQMDIFHAERHTDQSNFRIETNIRCFEPVVVR